MSGRICTVNLIEATDDNAGYAPFFSSLISRSFIFFPDDRRCIT